MGGDQKSRLKFVYLSGFLLAAHFASVTYVNSSLLKQSFGDGVLNILYALASVFGVSLLLAAPYLLRKLGSVPVFIIFIAVEIFAVLGMGIIGSASLIALLFFIHIAADSLLYLCLDINLEQEIQKEGTTGIRRGILLTISNTAWVLSPLALVFLISQNDFSNVYFLSGIALVPLLIIVGVFFKNTRKASVVEANIFASLRSLFKGGDDARIIVVQFILNFFYAWMVIYLPLLLNREMGFGWDKIGIIFTIMLLAFLIFELPAGILSDKKIGEKEILAVGLFIMFVTTFIIPFISVPLLLVWAAVLFATRVGASLVEIASESYFFKHVKEDDTGLISLFRIARPFSFVVAPMIAFPAVYFFSYSASFFFLAFFVFLGLFFIPKVDTK